ncbi:hypothetical protein GCM10010495_54950 [Kitasatospora herbaricolor]|uniref:Uncharacterized protein n=1 Tax=Kitasatospora herbaricolor TaxID=68217 RepID=A0ABZ1WGI7_9ACTN|nr:hypothetical protein [Kitasatospora herbaricolor]MDQ0307230.1 protein-S-isoprenylcysteine O-methyltransferase Ste14 [Kitasatospora herbaricolor]GGV31370.1 hypothetical protein GCM10010495_54950 [Kitasatospora herbaricolor]
MADADRDHSLAQPLSRAARLWSGGALHRHQLPLTVVGLACLAVGIVVAVAVPDTDGPAWVMAVAGCLAAGVLLLGRIAFTVIRHGRGVTL